jgi:hypothetical protein
VVVSVLHRRYIRFIVLAEQLDHELTTAETVSVLGKQKGFRKLFCLIMDRSLKSSGRAGAAYIMLKRILPILLILRIRERWKDASKTSTESSSTTYGSSPNSSKTLLASIRLVQSFSLSQKSKSFPSSTLQV